MLRPYIGYGIATFVDSLSAMLIFLTLAKPKNYRAHMNGFRPPSVLGRPASVQHPQALRGPEDVEHIHS